MTFTIEIGAPEPAAARALLESVAGADGVEPFGEAFVRGLEDEDAGHRHVLLLDDDALVGLAGVAEDSAELVVSPDARCRGGGKALLDAVDGLVGKQLPVWAHGDVAGAAELAAATGRKVVR